MSIIVEKSILNMLDEGPLSWRFSRSQAGLGAMGDLGSHHVDQARLLVGEVVSMAAMTKTWSKDQAARVLDVNADSFVSAAELENGASASFEASRDAGAQNLGGYIEVDGTKGSVERPARRQSRHSCQADDELSDLSLSPFQVGAVNVR
jgi:predicted dehydrogenase